jgi:FixJ family two-component response regulator
LLAGKQVVDFIQKPFTMRRLIDAIERAIKQSVFAF